jgi:hypothetical protein
MHIGGVLHLLHAMGHGLGLSTSDDTKAMIIAIVQFLGNDNEILATRVRTYYIKCAAFSTPPEGLSIPPSYLDFFKDARIKKIWVLPEGYPEHIVVLDAPCMLRIWPALMQEGWESNHSHRDANVIWSDVQVDIAEYHTALDATTSEWLSDLAYCFTYLQPPHIQFTATKHRRRCSVAVSSFAIYVLLY